VPQVVVPDNLKSAVIKADRYDPGLNRTYAEMAEHLSRDTQSYELRRHPVLRCVAQRSGPGSAR